MLENDQSVISRTDRSLFKPIRHFLFVNGSADDCRRAIISLGPAISTSGGG